MTRFMLGFDGELLLLWKLHKTYFQNMGISYNQQILEYHTTNKYWNINEYHTSNTYWNILQPVMTKMIDSSY